jgi:hypothetical protein
MSSLLCHRLRSDNLSDAIDEARKNAISECYAMVNAIERDYQEPKEQCTEMEHCDAMVLGGLVKALAAQELRPSPSSPFIGLSYIKVAGDFGKLSIPTLCEIMATAIRDINSNNNRSGYYSNSNRHVPIPKCGIKDAITTRLSTISGTLTGLELDRYCKKEQETHN